MNSVKGMEEVLVVGKALEKAGIIDTSIDYDSTGKFVRVRLLKKYHLSDVV